LANRTDTQRFVPRGIDDDGARGIVVFKLKFRFEISIRARACVHRAFG
jgi:hypothetical protein